MNQRTRRLLLSWPLAMGAGLYTLPRLGFSQEAVRPPRADKVMWGGFGFAVPNADVAKYFPMVVAALNKAGGQGKLAMGFADALSKSYAGGIADDPTKMLDANSDPALLFSVSLDFEQMILVPNEGGSNEFQLSFIYGLAQVLYLDLPRPGGSDGDLRVLYSFPFRVQSAETPRIGNAQEQAENFRKLLFDLENSLTKVFSRKVAQKKFREARLPKRLKVNTVSITPEALATLKELGLAEALNQQFFGQAFTASLSEKGDLSVLPYAQNDVLNGALAARFNKFPNISRVFSRLNDPTENNFSVDLVVHRVLRKSNGSSVANILYARGMSVFVKVTDVHKKTVVLEKKILLIENNELPKAMFNRLKDYDMRYLVQIAIKMFDYFSEGVMTESEEKLKAIGFEMPNDANSVKATKALFLNCRY